MARAADWAPQIHPGNTLQIVKHPEGMHESCGQSIYTHAPDNYDTQLVPYPKGKQSGIKNPAQMAGWYDLYSKEGPTDPLHL